MQEISFRMTRPLTDFMATLHKNGSDEKKLSKHVSQKVSNEFVTLSVTFPDDGQVDRSHWTFDFSLFLHKKSIVNFSVRNGHLYTWGYKLQLQWSRRREAPFDPLLQISHQLFEKIRRMKQSTGFIPIKKKAFLFLNLKKNILLCLIKNVRRIVLKFYLVFKKKNIVFQNTFVIFYYCWLSCNLYSEYLFLYLNWIAFSVFQLLRK